MKPRPPLPGTITAGDWARAIPAARRRRIVQQALIGAQIKAAEAALLAKGGRP